MIKEAYYQQKNLISKIEKTMTLLIRLVNYLQIKVSSSSSTHIHWRKRKSLFPLLLLLLVIILYFFIVR